MGAKGQGTAIMVVVALALPLALPAAALTARTGATATTERGAVERVETVTDVLSPVDVPERPVVTELPSRPEFDQSERDQTDRDRPTLRDWCQAEPHPAGCPDRPVNIRHLIWRLIKAGEWRLLFHLLIRLGII